MIAAGEDFHTLEQTLKFRSDESLIDVNITIINDELIESNETFFIYLSSDTGVQLSPHAKTEVIINDNDEETEVVINDNDVTGMAK